MRIARLSLATLAFLTSGCASSDKSPIVVAPSPDELPNIPTREDSYVQASIVAERESDRPRVVLVPEFKEPPLTTEEKEATGQLDPPYRLLPYALDRRVSGLGVGEWGGPDVSVASVDRNIATEPAQRSAYSGEVGGPFVGIDPFIVRILGHFPITRSAYSGPAQYPDIGIGDTRERARAMRHHGD